MLFHIVFGLRHHGRGQDRGLKHGSLGRGIGGGLHDGRGPRRGGRGLLPVFYGFMLLALVALAKSSSAGHDEMFQRLQNHPELIIYKFQGKKNLHYNEKYFFKKKKC
jgi:hypothetical protein